MTSTHSVAQVLERVKSCQTSSSHVHLPSARSGVNIGSGGSLSKEATVSGRLLESMTTEERYDGTWYDWCWKTPDHCSSSSSSNPRADWMWSQERHSPWLDQGSPQWNSTVDTPSNDPPQYGDGMGRSDSIIQRNGFQTVRETASSLCVPHTSRSREKGW